MVFAIRHTGQIIRLVHEHQKLAKATKKDIRRSRDCARLQDVAVVSWEYRISPREKVDGRVAKKLSKSFDGWQTHLLLELETLVLVFVLELVLLGLHALERLDGDLDLVRQTLDVAAALPY